MPGLQSARSSQQVLEVVPGERIKVFHYAIVMMKWYEPFIINDFITIALHRRRATCQVPVNVSTSA